MEALLGPMPYRSRGVLTILFVLGIVVLVGTWTALYLGEALFTESHLVGYYCCVTEQELPATGSLERTMSDFFGNLPGRHLSCNCKFHGCQKEKISNFEPTAIFSGLAGKTVCTFS